MKEMKTVVAGIAGAILAVCTAQAQTLLWYRFDGDGELVTDRGDEKVSLYFYENEAEKLILLTSLYLSAFGNPAHDYFPEIGLTRKGSGSSRPAEQDHSQS